jgi:hypothetical protein
MRCIQVAGKDVAIEDHQQTEMMKMHPLPAIKTLLFVLNCVDIFKEIQLSQKK